MRLNKAFVGCCMLCVSPILGAAINDPTKPIYSENANSSIVTNPVIKENKIILLQSILYGDHAKIAVINGDMFREGDVIDGVLMESIHKHHVMVKYKDNSMKVVLSKKVYINKLTGDISE